MLHQRVSIHFRIKQQKLKADSRFSIHMRITLQGKRFELSTGRSVDSSRWNQKSGRVNGSKEDAKATNAFLETWVIKVRESERVLLEQTKSFTLDQLKARLTGRDLVKEKMLLDVFQEHNQRILQLIEHGEYARGTYVHYETTKRHVREFMQRKRKVPDIPLPSVDYGFIQDFEYYLKMGICDHNTAMKYLGDLKRIVFTGIHRGYISKDPFFNYKMSRRAVEKEFLVEAEINAIATKKFDTLRLEQVRDIFIFSCYTGLAYADVKKLKRSEIRVGVDGAQWLFIARQKSTTPASIPLLPVPATILAKYAEFSASHPKGLVLPVLTNQKTNSYLKEIGDVCGIQKVLSFHTARHTFATSVTLNNNVSIESVSRMLGHKTLKQTQHYAKILDKKVAEDMALLKIKLT